MSNVELTEFQLAALAKFDGVRALTETGLARVLKCEKAVARHAITTLTKAGLIKAYGAYEFAITSEGQLRLGGKSKPDPKAKREADKIPSGESKFKVIEDDFAPALAEVAKTIAPEAVHSLPAADTSETEPARQVLVVPPEQAEAVTAQVWAEKPTELVELNQEAPADFDTLVRQGLARLNAQLGLQPVVIDRLELKIDTLGELAGLVGQVDANLEDLLLAVVKDLQRIADRSS